MLGFLKRLFSSAGSNTLVIEAYWCESAVKLPGKIKTPMGGTVSILNICVDIRYSVEVGNIVLGRVQLSRGGGRIDGSDGRLNVASRRGEGWYASSVCPESCLIEAVREDLASRDSRLQRIMLGKWRDANRGTLARSLVDALNAHANPEQVAELIATAGRCNEVVFTYTKPDGSSETRHVSIEGVSDKSIRARDHKDDTVKSFRIDRITNARNA